MVSKRFYDSKGNRSALEFRATRKDVLPAVDMHCYEVLPFGLRAKQAAALFGGGALARPVGNVDGDAPPRRPAVPAAKGMAAPLRRVAHQTAVEAAPLGAGSLGDVALRVWDADECPDRHCCALLVRWLGGKYSLVLAVVSEAPDGVVISSEARAQRPQGR